MGLPGGVVESLSANGDTSSIPVGRSHMLQGN